MKKPLFTILSTFLLMSMLTLNTAQAGGATQVENAIWAGDNIYSTVLTPTSFKSPPAHSTDTLYNFSMSGLTGQRSVSDAYPGSGNYNGGRWSVKMVVFTDQGKAIHDADNDGTVDFELTNSDAVLEHESLGHIEIMDTTVYFVCPLIQ